MYTVGHRKRVTLIITPAIFGFFILFVPMETGVNVHIMLISWLDNLITASHHTLKKFNSYSYFLKLNTGMLTYEDRISMYFKCIFYKKKPARM